jgi:hypothetical protein
MAIFVDNILIKFPVLQAHAAPWHLLAIDYHFNKSFFELLAKVTVSWGKKI